MPVVTHDTHLKLVKINFGEKEYALDPAVAKSLGEAIIDEANLALGKPAKPCSNCRTTGVTDRADTWVCLGCGMTRKEAKEFMRSLNEEKQDKLDV